MHRDYELGGAVATPQGAFATPKGGVENRGAERSTTRPTAAPRTFHGALAWWATIVFAAGASLIFGATIVRGGEPCASHRLLVCGWTTSNVVEYDGDDGTLVGQLVPGGSGGLNLAHSVELGADGLLYVASYQNSQVLRYDAETGAPMPGPNGAPGTAQFVTTGAGGLNKSTDLEFGPDGHLYVTSFNNAAVMRYDSETGDPMPGPLGAPGTAQFVTPGSGSLVSAEGLVFGPDGNLYVASGGNSRIIRYDGETGAFIDVFIATGSGGLNNPHAVFFGADEHLYVPAFGNHQVLRYDGVTGVPMPGPLGAPGTAQFVTPGSGGLTSAHGALFGPDGSLYVTSFGTDQVLRYDGDTGAFQNVFAAQGTGVDGPIDVLFLEGGGDGPLLGDIDLDGDVDLADHQRFVACITGPVADGPLPGACIPADTDCDDDVDLDDFVALQIGFMEP